MMLRALRPEHRTPDLRSGDRGRRNSAFPLQVVVVAGSSENEVSQGGGHLWGRFRGWRSSETELFQVGDRDLLAFELQPLAGHLGRLAKGESGGRDRGKIAPVDWH